MSIQFRKLNLNLINLLKDINKILGVYDLSLNKANVEDTQINTITNLNNMIESSILIDNDKMNKFNKSFLGNMDKILKKIDNVIKAYKNYNSYKKKESIYLSKRCSSPLVKTKSTKEISKVEKPFISQTNEKQTSNKIIVHRKNFSINQNK